MFQNQASGATFQNLLPDAIVCEYASDVYHKWHSVCHDLTTPLSALITYPYVSWYYMCKRFSDKRFWLTH